MKIIDLKKTPTVFRQGSQYSNEIGLLKHHHLLGALERAGLYFIKIDTRSSNIAGIVCSIPGSRPVAGREFLINQRLDNLSKDIVDVDRNLGSGRKSKVNYR